MIPEDWLREGELVAQGWLPFWCWNGLEDGVKDVCFDPEEDVNADLIKRDDDQSHEPVPAGEEEHWDEPKDLDDPLDDWPNEFVEEVVDEPVEAPKVVMKPEEEAKDHEVDGPEEVPDDQVNREDEVDWDQDDEHNPPVDHQEEFNDWPKELDDWKDDVQHDPESDLEDQVNEESED